MHICLRGNRRLNVFYDNSDKYEFLRRLESASNEHNTKIIEFALMDNHAHILVYTKSLTNFMRSFLISYVKWYNLKYTNTGNLFERPFLSVSKRKEAWLIETILYILQNPVKANICSHAIDYRWSSCRCHYKQYNALSKHISIDSSICDSYFETMSNFHNQLGQRIIKRCELTERGQTSSARIPDCEVVDLFNRLLESRYNNKKMANLSRDEKLEIIKHLNYNSLATLRQIASVTQENYRWVLQQFKEN